MLFFCSLALWQACVSPDCSSLGHLSRLLAVWEWQNAQTEHHKTTRFDAKFGHCIKTDRQRCWRKTVLSDLAEFFH